MFDILTDKSKKTIRSWTASEMEQYQILLSNASFVLKYTLQIYSILFIYHLISLLLFYQNHVLKI